MKLDKVLVIEVVIDKIKDNKDKEMDNIEVIDNIDLKEMITMNKKMIKNTMIMVIEKKDQEDLEVEEEEEEVSEVEDISEVVIEINHKAKEEEVVIMIDQEEVILIDQEMMTDNTEMIEMKEIQEIENSQLKEDIEVVKRKNDHYDPSINFGANSITTFL